MNQKYCLKKTKDTDLRKYIGLVTSILLAFVHISKASITETTCTPDHASEGNKKCQDLNVNAECPAGGSHCACKNDFLLKPNDNTICIQKITTVECTPDDQANGDTICQNVDENSECKTGTTNCACKNGYKGTDTCAKVLTGSCSTNADCTGAVPNSECSSQTCSCVEGFKTENSLCTKVLEGTCESPEDCTGTVSNTECSEQKCQCTADYIEDNHICKKALGKTCSDANDCVTNAECDNTCKCSSEFINTAGLCAPESSATSAWMTTSLIGTSLLTLVLRLIY